MSISSAYYASRSGLIATEKWSELTAGNIANANREGYVRKSANFSSGRLGEVRVTAIRRETDLALDRMHRDELGKMARQGIIADGLETYAARLGDPGDARSLSSRLTSLQSGFDLLSNNPADASLQRGVVEAATALALSLNETAAALADTRETVDVSLRSDVTDLNRRLRDLADLNADVAQETAGSHRRAILEDEVGKRLDELAELVDFTISRNGDGRLSIFTAQGAPLLEDDVVHTVAYNSTTGTLTAGTVDITPGRVGARGFEEGRIAGRIALVNDEVPQMQLQLDEFARALVEGFEGADGTLGPGQAGLFTDAGAAFNAGQSLELANRIAINDAVRPEAGGALWRIRDGMQAATQGPASDRTQISAFVSVLEEPQTFAAAAGLGSPVDMTSYAARMVADQQYVRVRAQDRMETLSAGAGAIEAARMSAQGVNLDEELQKLVSIEQAYAANSQVIRSLGEMLDTLLRAF